MSTKLILRLDADLIHRAKIYSKRTGKSLSQMVADYFALLDSEPSDKKERNVELPPLTRSLKGLFAKTKVSEKDYQRYLQDKYV